MFPSVHLDNGDPEVGEGPLLPQELQFPKWWLTPGVGTFSTEPAAQDG